MTTEIEPNRWCVFEEVRFSLAALIFVPVTILCVFNIGDWDYFFSRLEDQSVQEYLIYASLAFVYAFRLIKREFQSWIFFYGISIVFIGLSHTVQIIYVFDDNSRRWASDYVYATLYSLPAISVLIATLLTLRQQDLRISINARSERVIMMFGLLVTAVLMIAEFFPWVRNTYRATSDTWTFQATGTKTSISDCCYVTEFDLSGIFSIYLPLVGLGLIFFISTLGYHVAIKAFLPGMVWCLQETLVFFTRLGKQDPLEIWTEKQVSENGLSVLTEGLFGGYLFTAAFVCLTLILLLPIVIAGRSSVPNRH